MHFVSSKQSRRRSVPALRRFKYLVTAPLLSAACLCSQTLPGTQPLTRTGDLAAQMVDGMAKMLIRETEHARSARQAFWARLAFSPATFDKSIAPLRERLRTIIGATDARVPFDTLRLDATLTRPARVGSNTRFEILAVRWPVLDGVEAEGLLLRPVGQERARVLALPDADWTPEMLSGLTPGIPARAQLARSLAEQGCLVLVPTLIDRQSTWSGNPAVRMTNQTHREFIYRLAYTAGRHIIGYEVDKTVAAIDWMSRQSPRLPLGIFGYGEGGLIALYTAALDTRIDATVVSGYFRNRDELWSEPIYHNVWSLLRQFGDAELADMVAPRTLIIEASHHPDITGPPAETPKQRGAAPGRITTPPIVEVRAEVERAAPVFRNLGVRVHLSLVEGTVAEPGSDEALTLFLRALGVKYSPRDNAPPEVSALVDSRERQHRQFSQLLNFTESRLREATAVRERFWSKADTSSIEKWQQTTAWYRRYFQEEMLGKLPDPSDQSPVETRVIYNEPRWTGYEVLLPMWPDVYAYGILLVPKDLKAGERRPVVVTQHGLEGRPQEVIKPQLARNEEFYAHYGARLADLGYIVYAPQNPTIGGQQFRQLQRRANPLKLSLFSFIVDQHERTLDWLASLPFVDPQRIGFYGLSYGGVTAMRVPSVVQRYSFSICSANFTDWIWKLDAYDFRASYLLSEEYEMPEFNLANTFNYAELAGLIAPRPFMVEHGHADTASPDEWVAFEYAKVRRLYASLGIPDRTEIEFFNGGHVINHQGTFRFLSRFLNWPESKQ